MESFKNLIDLEAPETDFISLFWRSCDAHVAMHSVTCRDTPQDSCAWVPNSSSGAVVESVSYTRKPREPDAERTAL